MVGGDEKGATTVETREDQPMSLEPLPLPLARDVTAGWELRWWEGLRIAVHTPPAEKAYPEPMDPGDAIRAMTEWIGQNFHPDTVEFFTVHIAGLRLTFDKLVAEEYRRLEENVEVLEGMVRGAMEEVGEERSVAVEIAELKAQADRIETLITELGRAST